MSVRRVVIQDDEQQANVVPLTRRLPMQNRIEPLSEAPLTLNRAMDEDRDQTRLLPRYRGRSRK